MARGESEGGEGAPGLIASLRGLAATALGIARTRLELLANDLEEQRIHALQLVVLGALALFCGAVAILLASAWIVIALWAEYRLWPLGILTLLYAAGCMTALLVIKRKAADRSKAFSASLAELRRDEDALRR